ncbi:MAG: ATP-binding protein [Cyanobacteria bacterium P01_D01_bin.2]
MPGIRPFEQKDRSVFFGRDTDIEQLSRLIRLEKFVVLNGKSGLGKSSLLNAGVIPELERGGYAVEAIRLGAFDPKGIAELNTPYHSLYTQIQSESSYLAEVHPDDSLWMAAKHRQLRKESGRALVLVLDQFEELFTWPPEAVSQFKRELAALVNRKMPQALSQTLQKLPQDRFSEEQWEEIYRPLPIKVVMAIRADSGRGGAQAFSV